MQDDQSLVAFPGAGPFALPAAQSAIATGGSNGVEATLYCLIDGKGPLPQPIKVQMALGVARELGEQLMTAAVAAELASQKL